MIDYLYQTSDLNLFLILSSIVICFSIIVLLVLKAFWPIHLRYQENEVIGSTSALIIVIYGVIAGFATLNLINNNTAASDAIQKESNAIANIYRDSTFLQSPYNTKVQAELKRYLIEVLDTEWPLMNQGKTIPNEGDLIIRQIVGSLNEYKTENILEPLIMADMLTLARDLYDSRQERIQISYTSLNIEIWVVIIIGTLLALCVSYLFGVNFYLHIFIVVAAGLMTVSIMFLLISLDKPFQGEFAVGPDSLRAVLAYLS
jgi:hypothetical protein